MGKKRRIISKYLTPLFETSDKSAEWFGYYNYDTLNHDCTKMLCNRAKSENSHIAKNDSIELGYYDIPNGEWHKIGESDSWNWQQGAMAQWIPGEGNESKVIFNCSRDGHLISKIIDIATNEQREINWSIYGITPDGKKSIALDLERSYWCRAYHYQSVANPKKEGRIVEGDGIFEINLESNTRRLLIDIKEIVALSPDKDFDKMKHWVEHIMINPSGTRFCFLHRFSPVSDVLKYRTRICVADIDGQNLQVIPGWDTYMWSHFGWQGANNFAIYTYRRPSIYKNFDTTLTTQENSKIFFNLKKQVRNIALLVKKTIPKSFIRRILASNSGYQHYVIDSDGKYHLETFWIKPFFNIDGHPSFTSDGKYMLTDSYPDETNRRRLIVFNTENQKGIVVARMPENKVEGNASCDLHPKLSRDNKHIVFDTTFSGKHSMIAFEINWNLIKQELS